jgi:hypothetical protein
MIGGAAVLGCALAVSPPSSSAALLSPPPGRGLGSLPALAQGVVSAALRHDARADQWLALQATDPLPSDAFVQRGELSDSRGMSGEEFGEAVAISGRTIVVGTVHYLTAATDSEQGVAYVFTEPASGWAHATQTAVLRAATGQAEEAFGRSVSISGDTIIVGAPFRKVGKHMGQGAAYMFKRPASGWRNATPTATLTAAKGAASEFFGEAVALSGNTVLVGAPGRTVGRNAAQGAVDVFAMPHLTSAGPPAQKAQLTASDGQANDALGISVAIEGRTAVAGADLHSVRHSAQQGAACVFREPVSGWKSATQAAQLTDQPGGPRELFARSVAISHGAIVAGAPGSAGGHAEQGAAYVFVEPTSGWAGSLTQTARLTASDAGKDDVLGGALAIAGRVIVAGAPGHTTGKNVEQGAAYVFVEPTSGWADATETYELTGSNGAAGDRFGRAVAVAASGEAIIVGAPDREVVGELGQGAVYAFERAP